MFVNNLVNKRNSLCFTIYPIIINVSMKLLILLSIYSAKAFPIII